MYRHRTASTAHHGVQNGSCVVNNVQGTLLSMKETVGDTHACIHITLLCKNTVETGNGACLLRGCSRPGGRGNRIRGLIFVFTLPYFILYIFFYNVLV